MEVDNGAPKFSLKEKEASTNAAQQYHYVWDICKIGLLAESILFDPLATD